MQMKLGRFMIDYKAKIRHFPGSAHLCLRLNMLYIFYNWTENKLDICKAMKNKGLFSRRSPLCGCVPKQSRPKQMHFSIWHLPTFLTLMKAKLLALLHIFKLRKACVKSEAVLWGACARFLISCHRERLSTNVSSVRVQNATSYIWDEGMLITVSWSQEIRKLGGCGE